MVLPLLCKNASGNLVQKNTLEQKAKVKRKLLRQACGRLRKQSFIAKSENITVGELLDIWAEEELKTGTLSNGTVRITLVLLPTSKISIPEKVEK